MRAGRGLPAWTRWLIVAGAALLSVVSLVATPTGEALDCAVTPEGWTCEHERRLRFQSPRTTSFGASNTAEISFVEYTAGKGGRREMGRTEVFDGRGAPLSLFDSTRPAARAHFEELDSFVEAAESGAEPGDLHIEELPFFWGLGPTLILIVAGVVIFSGTGGEADGCTERPPQPHQSAATDTPGSKLQRRTILGVLGTVAVLTIALTIAESLHRRGKAWVQVQCVHRCKVEGMDCRPPGSVSSWQTPGTYTVQAYDPSTPGGWADVSIELEEGDHVTLQCKPPTP